MKATYLQQKPQVKHLVSETKILTHNLEYKRTTASRATHNIHNVYTTGGGRGYSFLFLFLIIKHEENV